MLMECVEAVKCENSVRPRECRGKPTLPQKLCFLVGHVVVRALAVVDIHRVNSGGVKNHEIGRPRRRAWAWASSVSKLNAKPKISETILIKEPASPPLINEHLVVTFNHVSIWTRTSIRCRGACRCILTMQA